MSDKFKIIRFLVKDIEGGRGRASDDYHIDLCLEKHGLFDLVLKVFDILHQKDLTRDYYYDHLWSFTFGGVKFAYGWRDAGLFRGPINHIDDKEPRLLKDLAKSIANGQKGSFRGESARFNVAVENTAFYSINESDLKVYPKSTVIKLQLSDKLEDEDWITDEEKQNSVVLREAWEDFYAGENDWKFDEYGDDGDAMLVPCQPQYGPWTPNEIEIMGLLIHSGIKFKKAWSSVLKFVFVNRSESGTSGRWYLLKGKRSCEIAYVGEGCSNSQLIKNCKRVAQTKLKKLLDKGVPTRRPNPDIEPEAFMRKKQKVEG